MYVNWYKVAKIQQIEQEAGLKEFISVSLSMALLAVFAGSTIWSAAQKYNVNEAEIEQALSNEQIINELQESQQQSQIPQSQQQVISTAIVNQSLIKDLKSSEGTISYQKHEGSFKNNKFYPYKDSRGYPTVGYGHLILSGENFANGISEQEADKMLLDDANDAVNQANQLLANVSVTPEAAQIIANMVFQMGKDGVRGFENMWIALQNEDYNTAADEMLKSDWYSQTPNRATALSDIMRSQ